MKQESFKEKVGNFFSKLGKKNLIIIASFAVVAVALVVGITVFNRSGDKGFDYSQGAGMQDVNGESDKETESKKDSVDTYFSSVELDRKRTRDEALEVLQGVVDNASSTEEARASALADDESRNCRGNDLVFDGTDAAVLNRLCAFLSQAA